jgi:hypothetical protein
VKAALSSRCQRMVLLCWAMVMRLQWAAGKVVP